MACGIRFGGLSEKKILIFQTAKILNFDNQIIIFLTKGSLKLTGLDVSNNTALIYLDCSFNQLTELDVSKNTVLAALLCSNNQFTASALNNLFGTLHSNSPPQYYTKNITIGGNPGTATCDQRIATARGWAVDTFNK